MLIMKKQKRVSLYLLLLLHRTDQVQQKGCSVFGRKVPKQEQQMKTRQRGESIGQGQIPLELTMKEKRKNEKMKKEFMKWKKN